MLNNYLSKKHVTNIKICNIHSLLSVTSRTLAFGDSTIFFMCPVTILPSPLSEDKSTQFCATQFKSNYTGKGQTQSFVFCVLFIYFCLLCVGWNLSMMYLREEAITKALAKKPHAKDNVTER